MWQTIWKVDRKLGDSHFLVGLMRAKANFLMHGSFCLNNGNQIRFLEDKWLGNYSFRQQYLSLYNLVKRKSVTVENVQCTMPLNVSFHRFLTQNNLLPWNNLVGRIMHVWLNDQNDVSIYNSLTLPQTD
jgi:hypothetical protein